MTIILEYVVDTARLFQSDRSQAVLLPKEYRFSGTEVVVKHFGNGVLLLLSSPSIQLRKIKKPETCNARSG